MDDEIKVHLSGKVVQKTVSNYLRNSAETQEKIQALVDKLALEEALFERIEKKLIEALIDKFMRRGQEGYELQRKVREEFEKRVLDGNFDTVLERWIKQKLKS